MNIKHIISLFALVLIVASCGSTKEATPDAMDTTIQNKTTGPDGSMDRELPNRPKRQAVDPEQLVAQLGLDEATEAKFLALWEGNDAKMKAIREEAKGDRGGMREKMIQLREERQNGLKEILTVEQLAKLRELTTNKMGKNGRGGRGN